MVTALLITLALLYPALFVVAPRRFRPLLAFAGGSLSLINALDLWLHRARVEPLPRCQVLDTRR